MSKPYELFWVNNVITVLSGFRFYVLLFIPIVVILILILMGIDHSRRYFKNQALRDSLTGLYNHRYLQDELRSLIKSGKDREISFLMMDLDNFKHVNDTYGHQVGDNILKKVAETLQENVRERDIAARYGGEEFAVILPETESKEAIKVAERIRKAIKACCGCTISIGVSSFLEHGTTADELIKNADLALYKAKDLSKDRVEKIDVKVNI